MMHPEWSRSCADCETWLYGDDGRQSMRMGLPLVRPKGVPTPCHKCPKIPYGLEAIRANAAELDDRGMQAYQHYLECRAVGVFPEDPIVRRNARIFRAVHDEYDKSPMWKLIALVGIGHGRRNT